MWPRLLQAINSGFILNIAKIIITADFIAINPRDLFDHLFVGMITRVLKFSLRISSFVAAGAAKSFIVIIEQVLLSVAGDYNFEEDFISAVDGLLPGHEAMPAREILP